MNEDDVNEINETPEVLPKNNEYLPFVILDNGALLFDSGYNVTTDIVDNSEILFETRLMKPYVSKFTTGSNKNVTMATIFKLCVIIGCSPNDLFNWEDWRGKLMVKMKDAKTDKYLITLDDIKKML
tara:strand:+ start:490 stop:867 length:378 start_codon:yes stop_codon:yes gene_type:complete